MNGAKDLAAAAMEVHALSYALVRCSGLQTLFDVTGPESLWCTCLHTEWLDVDTL